jgi:hypothetical protein
VTGDIVDAISITPATWLAFTALVLIFLTTLRAGDDLRRFVKQTPLLATADDLRQLERVAARGMIGTLVMLGLALLGGTAGILIFYQERSLKLPDLFTLLGAGLAVWLAGIRFKATERRVMATPAADDALQKQRDEIVTIWQNRLLPPWNNQRT